MTILFWVLFSHSVIWGIIIAKDPYEESVLGYLFSFIAGMIVGVVVIPGYFNILFESKEARLKRKAKYSRRK